MLSIYPVNVLSALITLNPKYLTASLSALSISEMSIVLVSHVSAELIVMFVTFVLVQEVSPNPNCNIIPV